MFVPFFLLLLYRTSAGASSEMTGLKQDRLAAGKHEATASVQLSLPIFFLFFSITAIIPFSKKTVSLHLRSWQNKSDAVALPLCSNNITASPPPPVS